MRPPNEEAQQVNWTVTRDGQEPCEHSALVRIELYRSLPDLCIHVACDFLSVFDVVKNRSRDRRNLADRRIVERGQCSCVALRDRSHQGSRLGVAQLTTDARVGVAQR
jgi:hypothetical protein